MQLQQACNAFVGRQGLTCWLAKREATLPESVEAQPWLRDVPQSYAVLSIRRPTTWEAAGLPSCVAGSAAVDAII